MNKMLNAMFVTANPTGLGVYSREILLRSNAFFNSNGFNVYLHESAKDLNLDLSQQVYVPNAKSKNPFIRTYYLNTLKPDFYYSFTHHGLQRKKGQQIVTIHDLIPLKFPKQYKNQYYYYKYVLPRTVKASSHVVTISEHTKKDLIQNYGIEESKVSVIYNGYEHFIDQNLTTIERFIEKPYILMVGATYAHKNILRALKAFFSIKDKVDLNCVIVGKESPYMDSLRLFVKEKKLDKRVQFLGYVTDQQLKSLYKYANLFLYPSLYEGFGLPVLEAMHYSIPTIASNESSIPEVTGRASFLVNPYNEAEIADAILQVESNSGFKNKLIDLGHSNLKRFSWNQTVEQIKKVINPYV